MKDTPQLFKKVDFGTLGTVYAITDRFGNRADLSQEQAGLLLRWLLQNVESEEEDWDISWAAQRLLDALSTLRGMEPQSIRLQDQPETWEQALDTARFAHAELLDILDLAGSEVEAHDVLLEEVLADVGQEGIVKEEEGSGDA